MLNQILYPSCLIILSVLGLSACDRQHMMQKQADHHVEIDQAEYAAKKLIDIAGQVNIQQYDENAGTQITAQAKPYVGRYRAKISCPDPLFYCDEGRADLILNLLPDGTAHRAIIHLGEMGQLSNNLYRQYHWFYDESSHKVILQQANDIQVSFDIDQSGRLIMNTDKLSTATTANRQFYAQKYDLKQQQNYILVKEP